MKKVFAAMLTLMLFLPSVPCVPALAQTAEAEAVRAFGWDFDSDAQNGTLPTAVSWNNYRACFMSFDLPQSILEMKGKKIKATAYLTADMTFNNGRRSGQAPVVTIIRADAEAINSADLRGGAQTSALLKGAWEGGAVLGTFDTLSKDISEEMDITDIVAGGETKIGLYITCRAEDGYFNTAGIVNFINPRLSISCAELTAENMLAEICLPYNLTEGYELPSEIYGSEIKWSEEEIRAGEKSEYITLTAEVEGKTRGFDVMIMGKADKFLAAYTTDESAAGKSMHLAINSGSGWEELNFGLGVLFAAADLDEPKAGETRVLESPWLYRRDDGKIGVCARTVSVAGENARFELWESGNAVDFISLGEGRAEGFDNAKRVVIDEIDGAVSSVLPITDEEADYISKKLGEVKNVGAEKIVIGTQRGERLTSLPNLTALYSDGSKAEIPVEWDTESLDEIDFDTVGIYTVSGEASVKDYGSPMITGAADPVIYKYKDKYYFIATNETGGQVDLYIRCAETIEELSDAEAVCIFKHTSSGDHSGCNWAPELHEIGGSFYCLFASSTTGKWNAVQCRVMKCVGDPMKAADWEEPVMVTRSDGSSLIAEGITLDMTYFESGGEHYYAWAERPITSQGNGNSRIVIAMMDPSDPTRISSEPVVIRNPDCIWDRRTATVDEGPNVLKHDGRLYMTFSGSGVDSTYCLGLLTAEEGSDLLKRESWRETGYPVLSSEHVANEFGPGHNFFTADEYGRDVIVLHMKPNGSARSATARTIHYAFDGTPIFYMTAERYLKEEYRSVTATVVVSDENTTEEELLAGADLSAISFLSPDETTADLILTTEGAESGKKIEWSSSNAKVISRIGKVTRGERDEKVCLTASIGKFSREFSFTVLAKEEDEAYLFAYFTGNSASQERLFYGVSADGLNFRALNGGESVLTSDLGTGCIRDPFIFKGEDGYYYIIATDMKSSLGWSSNYATVVYKTPDLINIVDKERIDYREFPSSAGCTRAWAPQAVWCPEKGAYMVYLAMNIPSDPYGTVMYRQYAEDLCDKSTYTDVELMLDEPPGSGAGAIDGDIIYDKFSRKYIMYYDGKRVASCETLSGEWKRGETKYSDGQIPFNTAAGVPMAVEGSNIWKIIGEERWIIAADGTAFNGGCYALAETRDFENYTQLWSDKGEFSFDFTPRHGYVIPISKRELKNLFEKYGYVELPYSSEISLDIDLSQRGADIAEDMYGIFFEDINYAADGGIYSEVVQNRSFEAVHCNPDKGESLTPIPSTGWTCENASAQYLSEKPLNENNPTYVRLTAQKGGGIKNACYSGFAVHEGESFKASFFARGDYKGEITISVTEGEKVLGSVSFAGISGEFKKYEGKIKTRGTAENAVVTLTLSEAGEAELDMISVMSCDTFNGRDNGLRKDIVKMLADLHPGFVRFPGGCVAEGYYLDNRYSWKDSVGPVEERKENWNRWQTGPNAYDYCQTYGLGFYEYFLLCEDIGAKPLPVVSAGIACQYQSGEASSREDLYGIYIRDALDLIEFANGDPEESEWAAIRAEMGHPAPFNLEYIGIGNEQWNTSSNRFFERFEAFEEEIHKKYSGIKLIATSGPSADGDKFENAWEWLKTHKGEEGFAYAVDEHYYRTPEWFLANSDRYDDYDRDLFGVFAGEYAANGTYKNTLYSALAEAAFMTGLEKNADVVRLASYAPLLAKDGYTQWSPNLIWFNNSSVYGSPDYYVQSMYSNNSGSFVVGNELKSGGRAAMRVKADYEPEEANRAANLIDGDISTRWAVNKYGSNAVIDLGEETEISQISVNFWAKPDRRYYYMLEISSDGENFVTVFDGESEVNSSAAHLTEVNASARFVRLTSKGTSEGTDAWFSPTEISIFDRNGDALPKGAGAVYSSASYDEETGDIIVKIVNVGERSEKIRINISGASYIAPEAKQILLTGSDRAAANSFAEPTNVCAKESVLSGVSESFDYETGALSFAVIRLHTSENYGETYSIEFDADRAYFKAPGGARAHLARYSPEGELLRVISDTFTCERSIPVPEGEGAVKAFIWDENMRPLAKAEK